MNDLTVICSAHGMDYEVGCDECSQKEELFCQQVEKVQKQLHCTHDTIDLGDSDHMYLICVYCGLKNADTEFYVLPDYKGLPN